MGVRVASEGVKGLPRISVGVGQGQPRRRPRNYREELLGAGGRGLLSYFYGPYIC